MGFGDYLDREIYLRLSSLGKSAECARGASTLVLFLGHGCDTSFVCFCDKFGDISRRIYLEGSKK